jgi:hypothetical protein
VVKRERKKRARTSGGEWIGARLLLPVYVHEDPPFRPCVALWIDGANGAILSQQILGRDFEPDALFSTLIEAMEHPMIGPPRKPKRVRVAEAEEGERLKTRLDDIEVTIAATPEVDEILGAILDSMDSAEESSAPALDQSYFEHGRLDPTLFLPFFEKAAELYRLAPWTMLEDSDVLAIDAPQLGLSSACLSVLGSLGHNLGFVLFESPQAYRSFVSFFEELEEGTEERSTFLPIHTGSSSLAVNYSGKDELSETMQREIREHHLSVAGPYAYPVIISLDADSVPRPVSERDVRVATAVLEALCELINKRHRELELPERSPIDETVETSGDEVVRVRVTVPHPSISWGELPIDMDEEDAPYDDRPLTLEDLDLAIHAHIYDVVESQLSSGDPPQTRQALDRLMRQGLRRADAVHAIGVVLVGELMRAMEEMALKPSAEYAEMLDRLDADGWGTFEKTPPKKPRKKPRSKRARRKNH